MAAGRLVHHRRHTGMRLRGRRIKLRPGLKGEDEFVRRLLSEVAADDTDCSVLERHVVERKSDGAPIGIVDHRVSEPAEGWATFGAIVMSDGQRGWGYGAEAVGLIEDHVMKREGVRRFRARVDKRIGLALYFWLRRGYRPARAEEAFWPGQES
ncbi:MAG: GNAT family N-acetyltransferase, partial [Dehalococcoidia bacterium]